MKAIRRLLPALAILLGCVLPGRTLAAPTYTDGMATFNVTLLSQGGGYAPRHVDAVWVVDSSGRFVKTLRYDANARRQYLYQWVAARGTWPWNAPIDGYSGATAPNYNAPYSPITIAWNCRNTNSTLQPDGMYRFFIEFTDRNGQGQYTTNGIPFWKGMTNVNQTFPNSTYIQNMSVAFVPSLAYDVAVTRIFPPFAPTNSLAPVTVLVTNKTSVAGSFTVTLSNATSGVLIGSQMINNLGGNEVTNVVFTWNTAGLGLGSYSIVARASAVPNETNLVDNALTYTITLREPTHDVAVAAITVPAAVRPEMRTNVTITVTNKGDAAESFAVVLTDDTDAKAIGTNQVSSLAALTGTTTIFQWNTTNATWGAHTLRAEAATVPLETLTADNTLSVLTVVTPPMTTNIYLVRNDYWRYNDQGVDLGTTWREVGFDDNVWPLGRGPLGYGDAPTNTVLYYGPVSTAKYPTYYFRAQFNLTNVPETLTMRLRRDDGAVVYINGVEAYRTNLPTGTISYTTWALAAVGNADETTYFQTNLPTSNLVLGTNLIAVEMHQSAGDSSDLSFDMELLGAIPPAVPMHDVAVATITVTPQVLPSTTTNVTVVVTNRGHFTESFAVSLTDDTDAVSLGSQNVSNLATNSIQSLSFPWTTPSGPWINHTLRAVAGPVISEAARTDNTNFIVAFLAPPLETNVLIVRSNWWRYNDGGFDLTMAPWKERDYIDTSWGYGQGSFGYGDAVTTTNSYGVNANSKYPTYYYRAKCNIDILPAWMSLRLRRDDGAVVYLNGAELYRVNVTNDPVTYASWATTTVDGANETIYFENEVPVTNAVLGTNIVAVEIHQVNATSSDISFDMELLGINPITARIHDVAVAEVKPDADVMVGDLLKVAVTVTNRGNASETFTVYLRDTVSQQIVGSTVLNNMAVGASSTAVFDWKTVGAAAGAHNLEAFTVQNGITNLAGTVSAIAGLEGTGFGLNTAGVLGSLGGYCAAVAASGDLLLIGAGATLEVWNKSVPLAPMKLGQIRLPARIEGLTVGGTFAYAACGDAGVQFIDLSTPSKPVHVKTYDTSGHAYGVALSGNYLYVADGASGLRIVNVATPANPSLAGAYYTEGPARAVAVFGTRAYVLDADAGLLILSVANPAAPLLLGAYTGYNACQALAVAGSVAYVVDANNHFFAVSAANPVSPTLLGSLLLTNLVPQSLAFSGSTVYVAVGASGLATISVAAPTSPVLVSITPTPGESSGVAVDGAALYVADGFHGFLAYDVSAPTTPSLQADLPTSIRACDVVVTNNLAFVAAGEGGLRIYNVANPAAPAWLGWFAGAQNARCVAVSGSTAYVGDGQYGLKIVNVATPDSPALLGSWSGTNFSSIRNIGVSGSHVVASDGRRVCLFDVSAPGSPALTATYSAPAFAFDMTVSGGRAFLACGNAGLVVLGINPSSLTQLSIIDTPGIASGVAVSGNTAYVADGAAGWRIYDVSNPTVPALLSAHSAQGPVSSVAVSGVLATLGNGANAAVTMDVTTPLAPVSSQNFAGLANALRITAAGGQAYLSENDAGLAVLAAGGGPLVLQMAPPVGGSGELALKWVSKTGKTYAIYRSTDLSLGQAGFSLVQGNIAATPPMNSVSLSNSGTVSFYIISEQ